MKLNRYQGLGIKFFSWVLLSKYVVWFCSWSFQSCGCTEVMFVLPNRQMWSNLCTFEALLAICLRQTSSTLLLYSSSFKFLLSDLDLRSLKVFQLSVKNKALETVG